MQMSHEEAQTALGLVEDAQKRLKKAISAGYAANLLLLWGGIWIIGFLSLQCLGGPRGGLVYSILDGAGILASVYFIRRSPHRNAIRSPQSRLLIWHVWGLWFAVALFGALWALVLKPTSGIQLGLYLCTLSMFAYVVMGLWFMSTFMVWLGLAVTALTVAGYYWLPTYFYGWMAVTGGGTLCGTGLYIRR